MARNPRLVPGWATNCQTSLSLGPAPHPMLSLAESPSLEISKRTHYILDGGGGEVPFWGSTVTHPRSQRGVGLGGTQEKAWACFSFCSQLSLRTATSCFSTTCGPTPLSVCWCLCLSAGTPLRGSTGHLDPSTALL